MPNNNNPNIDDFLKIYSQSLLSTSLTRGLDKGTYVKTKLDTALKDDVLNGKKKLVVLTGNAGDGKTAFIQLIEETARNNGGLFSSETDNGCVFSYNGYQFETLYDGSQDFDGKSNYDLLKLFFRDFEGDKEPSSNIVKIIAINEGKLRDFILSKKEYKWLGKQVHHYLEYDAYRLPDSLAFINLNNRAVVESINVNSIFDNLIETILDKNNKNGYWQHCAPENCAFSKCCYIKYNIDRLRNNETGDIICQRLKELILCVYLKKEKHITMRDIRSLISFILFNKFTCSQIQNDIQNDVNLIDRFYYNNAFNKNELDRLIKVMKGIDVADVPLPKLENQLYSSNPRTELDSSIFVSDVTNDDPDLICIEKFYNDKPQGTSDSDKNRHNNADIFLSSIKRKLYFEGNDDFLNEQFEVTHYNFLPYRYYRRFIDFLETGNDSNGEIRNSLVLAISKSEKIYNEIVGSENVCIGSNRSKSSMTKAFYGFPAADFEVVLPERGKHSEYIESFPDHIVLRHVDKTASLEINIDLFEILMRIKEGYIPTSIEIQTFFLNLEMFKRRILAKSTTKVILTEDDATLYELKKAQNGKLVLTKL